MSANIVCVIWGQEGSGKSSMALTFPKPLKHYDIDVGGFDRAIWRLTGEGITSKSYPIPVQIEKLTGAKKEGMNIRFPRRVTGYKELWQEIVTDYVEDCQDKSIATIVLDSATQLWTICHSSMLQEKQEIQISQGMRPEDAKFREKLLPIEFPNDRMRSLIYTARSYGKNLVLTHYPRNVYKEQFNKGELVQYKSDDLEPDGFKDTTKLVDVVFWTFSEKGQAHAKITIKCALPGLGMSAVEMELPEPSYNGIMELKKMMSGG